MPVTVGQDDSADDARAKRTPLRYPRKHNKLKMILFLSQNCCQTKFHPFPSDN